MQPSYLNPNRSKPVIIAHIQNVLLAITIFFIASSQAKSFYNGGIDSAINGVIVMAILALVAPINLVTSGYFLVKKRRNYAGWATIYMIVSLVFSLLIVGSLSRAQ